MSDLKLKIYFPPSTPIERMQYERDDFASRAQKRAEYDAQVLRDYDERIAAMKQAQAQNESVAS